MSGHVVIATFMIYLVGAVVVYLAASTAFEDAAAGFPPILIAAAWPGLLAGVVVVFGLVRLIESLPARPRPGPGVEAAPDPEQSPIPEPEPGAVREPEAPRSPRRRWFRRQRTLKTGTVWVSGLSPRPDTRRTTP